MPRRKTRSDADVLDAALALVHDHGVERLTFAALAQRCELSTATLVQRFATKPALVQRTLLHAWDRLDARTAELAATVPATPAGAVELLVDLSRQYEHDYRTGLLVLHEDLRDPVLRARGAAWETALTTALDTCFAATPGAPPGVGHALACHWQGALTWWAFRGSPPLAEHLGASLRDLVTLIAPPRE